MITEIGVRTSKCPNCGRVSGEVQVPGPSFVRDVFCDADCRTLWEDRQSLPQDPMEVAMRQSAECLAYGAAKANGPTREGRADESQALPTVVPGGAFIHELVMADLQRRMDIGTERYGTPLQAHNGRNPLLDAYEELLDLLCYFKQRLVEEGAGEVRATDLLPDPDTLPQIFADGKDVVIDSPIGPVVVRAGSPEPATPLLAKCAGGCDDGVVHGTVDRPCAFCSNG